jgi:hypothetical protein
MRKSPSVMVLTGAGFHPPLLLKPLDDLLEIRRVALLIGSRVPLGERRYGRTSVLRDTYQATIASTARTAVPKLNVAIDGSIIRRPSLLRTVLPAEGAGQKTATASSVLENIACG